MLPAIAPVVKLYGRAAAAGRVAPLPFFVAGYIAVWSSIALPAYAAWRALSGPIADARPWAGRLAGVVLVAAAVWQLTPVKSACLRHCRSPISFFLRFGARTSRPSGALRMGVITGEPHAVAIDLGTGFIWKRGDCGQGSFHVEAEGVSLDFTDSNWIYYDFDWTNQE